MRTEDRRLLRDMTGDGRDDVLSLYVPVDPADPRNQRPVGEQWWRSKARSLLGGIEHDLVAADQDPYAAAIDQLQDFLSFYVPDGRSVAVFADSDALLAVPLQVPVTSTGSFGPPLVGPLAEALYAHRLHHVVQISRDQIRVVEVAAGEATEVAVLNHDSPWDMGWQTRSGHRFRYEARREQYERRYHDRIADRLDRAVEDGIIGRLVLSGEAREAHGVLSALSERSRHVVVGVVPAALDEPLESLAERVAPILRAYEDDQEERAIDDVLRRHRQSGTGTVGLANTMRALEMQIVRRLVLGRGLVGVDATETLIRLGMSQGADVKFILGPARDRLEEYEGVIAELHFNPYADGVSAPPSGAGQS